MLKQGRKREAKGLAVLYFIIGLIILLIILISFLFSFAFRFSSFHSYL